MPIQTPYPFTALVGQDEVKDALILAAVNPRVQGVLLIGPKGTGKTTAVRGLANLLPPVIHSLCPYGCDPGWALSAPERLCESCVAKLSAGEPTSYIERQAVVELPLNATMDDVVGGANARASLEQQRLFFEPGILAHANGNFLYIDEINLVPQEVLDAILDAAATGWSVVRRGRLAASYPARFVLIGSMNPEMGALRPQIIDRIGLRVMVGALEKPKERIEVSRRSRQFGDDPEMFSAAWEDTTYRAASSIARARALLPSVNISEAAEEAAIGLVTALGIESSRTEIVLVEAARAYAATDERTEATVDDVMAVAAMVLRYRKSGELEGFFATARQENTAIKVAIDSLRSATPNE